MQKEILFPDKKIVHKGSLEDVLVCNVRKALPYNIDGEKFELIVDGLNNQSSKDILKKYYQPADSVISQLLDKYDGHYLLSSIPFYVANDDFEEAVVQASKYEKDFLQRSYDEQDGYYILNVDYLTENEELLLLSVLGLKTKKIDDYNRALLSGILEKCAGIEWPEYAYCTMYNDMKHPYFYQKDHEHVPGVMLIEAVRQASYAYFYQYLGFVRGEITVSLGKMDMEFFNYAQSNYPVRLMIEDIGDKTDTFTKTGVQRLGLRITMYQMFKVVGIFNVYGPAIRMDVFKTIRTAGSESDEYRFLPVKNFNPDVLLIGNDGIRYECSLQDISQRGFRVTRNDEIEDVDQQYNFVFFVKNYGFIEGFCAIKWQKQESGESEIGIEIVDLSENAEYKIKEVIKLYTSVIDKREVL